ncbi:MAG: TlpA family protein disulfide reductase, partial [Candidatus Hodarchaeales archaeon]
MTRKYEKIPQNHQNSDLAPDDSYEDLTSIDRRQTKQQESRVSSSNTISPFTLAMAVIIISIVGLTIISLASTFQPNNSGVGGPPNLGTSLSDNLDFRIQLLNETEVMLSDYSGKPIILDFMATWCTFCKQQNDVFKDFKPDFPNVQIISVTVDLKDTIADLTTYKENYGITWT